MPNLKKRFDHFCTPDGTRCQNIFFRLLVSACLLPVLLLCPTPGNTADFTARIKTADLQETTATYSLQAQIDYQLSPEAKEALHKGVPLAWDVLVKISKVGWPFNTSLYEKRLPYILQFHALLNQYEVKNPGGQMDMFLSLNAALNFMANVHELLAISAALLPPGQHYLLAVKSQFNREFLPTPLRPVAYLDSQWFLSSAWFLWPIQK